MTTLAWQTADGGPLDLDAVKSALSAQFGLAIGAKEVVRRTRLDTFDRRLRAAGLTLEHQTAASGERLVLSRSDAVSTLVAPVSGLNWPALAGALPVGPLRDVVAPVASIRALMVVSDEKRSVSLVDLHNADQKTVARVELDTPAGPGSTSPAELTVRRLRGYDDQAKRAARLLADLGLQSVQAAEAGDKALAGRTDSAAPATELLAGVLSGFLDAMRKNLPGLLDDVDTEFLHDFRVAVRRTRSTLKLGRPALPEVMRSRWEAEFKWLGDLTTPVRDLDVYELDLPAMAGWLVGAEAADLEPFAVHLRRRRTTERRALVRGLRSTRFQRLVTEWQEALAELADTPNVVERERLPASELAAGSISRAHRHVARGGAAIYAESPVEDLHTLRKRCKELRYALEVFAPVIGAAESKRAVGELKSLQDVLGRLQDSEVQRLALREFVEEMMSDGTSTGAVLAMGELIGHLDGEQDRARRAFDSAFAHFVRPSSHQSLHRLGGGH